MKRIDIERIARSVEAEECGRAFPQDDEFPETFPQPIRLVDLAVDNGYGEDGERREKYRLGVELELDPKRVKRLTAQLNTAMEEYQAHQDRLAEEKAKLAEQERAYERQALLVKAQQQDKAKKRAAAKIRRQRLSDAAMFVELMDLTWRLLDSGAQLVRVNPYRVIVRIGYTWDAYQASLIVRRLEQEYGEPRVSRVSQLVATEALEWL